MLQVLHSGFPRLERKLCFHGTPKLCKHTCRVTFLSGKVHFGALHIELMRSRAL